MSAAVRLQCDGRDGSCTEHTLIPAVRCDVTIARQRAARWGWTTGVGGLDHCPTCSRLRAREAYAPLPATARMPAVAGGAASAELAAAAVTVDGIAQCAACADGDHHLCRGGGCRCTAAPSCGGLW